MRRRDLLVMLGGVAMARPFAACAQKSTMPTIGYLGANSPGMTLASFQAGLAETGYIDGKNVVIEFRWSEGNYDRLPALAADLVNRNVAVLVAAGGRGPALAAKAATSTIPIVFTGAVDAVGSGLVASLSRPGGNVTGVSLLFELVAKRIELLHELVPKATVIALLVNPDNDGAAAVTSQAQEVAHSFGQQLHVLRARTEQEIDAAFATLVQLRAQALVLAPDPFFNVRREQLARLEARYAVPANLPNGRLSPPVAS